MNKKELDILKKAVESNQGLLSPSILVNSIAGQDRQAVENLVAQKYLELVPEQVGDHIVNFYRITEKGIVRFRSLPQRFYFSFKTQTTLYVAIASIIFGLISSLASWYTIQGVLDSRRVLGVGESPTVYFDANLNYQTYEEKKVLPHFNIKNVGAIAAIQTNVSFTVFEYDEKQNKVSFSMFSDDDGQNFVIGKLDPLERRTVIVDGKYISLYLKNMVPSKDNIIEAQISYRREWDKKLFVDYSYYFSNQEGGWDAEDEYLPNTKFQKMKEAVNLHKVNNNF